MVQNNTSNFSNFKLTQYLPNFPFFTLPKHYFKKEMRGYKEGTRRVHRLTQNQTSCSNLTQKLIWVLGDKIIDLLRVSPLLVPYTAI